jgi:hypothetical protein
MRTGNTPWSLLALGGKSAPSFLQAVLGDLRSRKQPFGARWTLFRTIEGAQPDGAKPARFHSTKGINWSELLFYGFAITRTRARLWKSGFFNHALGGFRDSGMAISRLLFSRIYPVLK